MSHGCSVTSIRDQQPSGRIVFSCSINGVLVAFSMFAACRGGVVVMTKSKFWGLNVLSLSICQVFPPQLYRNAVTGAFNAMI